jgi:hypothetical protein
LFCVADFHGQFQRFFPKGGSRYDTHACTHPGPLKLFIQINLISGKIKLTDKLANVAQVTKLASSGQTALVEGSLSGGTGVKEAPLSAWSHPF